MLPVTGRMRGAEALDAVPTRVEDFYSVLLGQNPPERRRRQALAAQAITVVSDRLIFRPRTAVW